MTVALLTGRPGFPIRAIRAGSCHQLGASVIILGIILGTIGFLSGIGVIWTIGMIILVIGSILALLGSADHTVGGRTHYY
jgi:Family of unknown function (DUF6131)